MAKFMIKCPNCGREMPFELPVTKCEWCKSKYKITDENGLRFLTFEEVFNAIYKEVPMSIEVNTKPD